MLIRRVVLKNIRSYSDDGETAVDVPEGTILFEGDVGSGKSTLLYAVEFALFGFSNMEGSHLLSEGKKEGYVEVKFSAEGKDYLIKRSLARHGQEVLQAGCYISVDGNTTKLSPSDLKQRLMAVLKFNEPTHPKAESLVYRYAVFTPQEQMKEILLQKAEERLQVIRRVLGVQIYEVASLNSETVARRIDKMGYGLRMASDDLPERRTSLKKKREELEEVQARIPTLEKEAQSSALAVERLEADWKNLRDKREQISAMTGRIPDLVRAIKQMESLQSSDQKKVSALQTRLAREITSKIESFERLPRPERGSEALEVELEETRNHRQKLMEDLAVLESRLKSAKELASLGFCPTCGQKIPQNFASKSEHLEAESVTMRAGLRPMEPLLVTLSLKVREARNYEMEKREYQSCLKQRETMEEEITGLKSSQVERNEELSRQTEELSRMRSQLESSRILSDRIEALESELAVARETNRSAGSALVRAKDDKKMLDTEIGNIVGEVERKEKMRSEARRLEEHRGWLLDFFVPTVGMIEEKTLSLANARFNHHFQRYFSSLVDDQDMVVRVREDFSPVFERQGFEQDFDALSGGERTSMALAYRFALNSVVREDLSAQSELVILDEPTDGFSKEQIYKVRSLLEELNSKQVILVSHERELESMADHVFLVDKTSGFSRVSRT